MAYINIETQAYPVSEQEIRNTFPNTSFPTPFSPPEGYAPVLESPVPTYDPITEGYREVTPTQDTLGNWMRVYDVYTLDAEQITANVQAKKDRVLNDVVTQTQARLDDFAKTRNYDGILSLATYATSTNARFQSEGQYGVTARDATWAKLYEIMAEVEAGTRLMPEGFADIEPELPVLEWPLA